MPRSVRRRRSLLKDPDDRPGDETLLADGEVRKGHVAGTKLLLTSRQDTNSASHTVLQQNAHPSQRKLHTEEAIGRTDSRAGGNEGFAETKRDYPVG